MLERLGGVVVGDAAGVDDNPRSCGARYRPNMSDTSGVNAEASPWRNGPWLPSPVPSDAVLDEGELPFTAFGQWGEGRMDQRVFDQDVWWVDREGVPHALEAMSPEYVGNVAAMLSSTAVLLHMGALRKVAIEVLIDAANGRPNADVLAVAAGGASTADLTPEGWLEATPLMRRLRRLQAEHAREEHA